MTTTIAQLLRLRITVRVVALTVCDISSRYTNTKITADESRHLYVVAMDGCGRALGYGSLFDRVNDRLEIERRIATWWDSDALAHAFLDAVAGATKRYEGQPASK